MRNLLLFLMVFCIIIGCRRRQEPVPEVMPELQITSIRFPSIPDKDVTIDQTNRVIYVKMPSLLEVNNLKPTIKLSVDARLTNNSDVENISYINYWCYPDKNYLKIGVSRQINPNEQIPDTVYTIKPIPSAPLKITSPESILQFALGDSSNIHLDVENLYGNALPKSVLFTNLKTGTQLISVSKSTPSSLNKLKIWPSAPFELGDYNIALSMQDGSLLKIPQTLRVVQGRTNFSGASFSLITLAGKNLTVSGENLFEGAAPFNLVQLNGTKIPLKAVYTSNGKTATLAIPASLSPGYYAIELGKSENQPHISRRLSVLRYEGQPIIGGMDYKLGGYLTVEPLVLSRIRQNPIAFSGIVNYTNGVVAFKDESDEKKVFRFPFSVIPSSIYYIIPEDVPAGRYKAFIQELDPATKQVMRESEPYERIVVLQ